MKPYLTHAVIGDGRMLGTLSERGELERLFWPTIDYADQVGRLWTGLRFDDSDLLWLHELPLLGQRYEADTNVLETEFEWDGFRIVQTDCVVPGQDALVRQVTVRRTPSEQKGTEPAAVRVRMYAWTDLHLDDHVKGNAVRFDAAQSAMVHYRRDVAAAVSGDAPLLGFQAGGVQRALAWDKLLGVAESLGSDSCLIWDLGVLIGDAPVRAAMFVGFAHGREQALEVVRGLRADGAVACLEATRDHWRGFLEGTLRVATGREDWDRLFRRSLLVFGLMSDARYGGLIAAPEFDAAWTECGGYGYCWGRDAAYIATALSRAGLVQQAERFYDWARSTQDADGKWDHRHYMDGQLAPSWGFQADEPASIVWGIWEHYKLTRDRGFLLRMAETLHQGADYLATLVDPTTGLPRESMDLWEERFAQHTYSAAAVSAALDAAAQAAVELALDEVSANRWRTVAAGIRETISERLWDPVRGCFDRGLQLHLPLDKVAASDLSADALITWQDEWGYERTALSRDRVVDVSLLGLSYPFGLLAVEDPRLLQLAESVRRALWVDGVGGILRYEDDRYIGGNPWVLTTLWVGLDALRRGDIELAQSMCQWASDHQTALGLLPEQVDRRTGQTRWVVPLTWSHAMWVLLIEGLQAAGAFTSEARVTTLAL